MLRKETLEHFENNSRQSCASRCNSRYAYIWPLLNINLGNLILDDSSKTQEHKRKETEMWLIKFKKEGKLQIICDNEFDNVSGVQENTEEHGRRGSRDTNEFTVQPDDAKFNYMSHELVHNAAGSFFDIENSFETGSNLVPGCSLDIDPTKKNNYFEK